MKKLIKEIKERKVRLREVRKNLKSNMDKFKPILDIIIGEKREVIEDEHQQE